MYLVACSALVLIHGASGYVASVLILMLASEHTWHHRHLASQDQHWITGGKQARYAGKLSGFLLMLYVRTVHVRAFVRLLFAFVACVLLLLFMLDSISHNCRGKYTKRTGD